MAKPIISSIWFGDDIYERMADVFQYTARKHCPEWDLHVDKVDKVHLEHHSMANHSHVANTQKMEAWNRVVQQANEGDRILLVDSDTFFTNSIDDVWEDDFDLAYTTKDTRFPFNSGVVFVRVSDRVKAFFEEWADINRLMLRDVRKHTPWRAKFGGINQAAFGKLLTTDHADTLTIIKLPCRDWNCEDSSWQYFDPSVTRIVHVKGDLRRAIFREGRRDRDGVPKLRHLWLRIEQEMNEGE